MRKLKRQAAHHLLINGVLYKIAFSLPLLKCLTLEEAKFTKEYVTPRVLRLVLF